ncbi:MAG TPA: protein kinase [Candidatus Baltobacteraceae bacterium]|nr:protein kinase [Candidatus Baltobacteraceae bacterium]
MIATQRFLQGQIADGRFPLIEYLGGTEHSAVFLTEYSEAQNQRATIKLILAPPGNCEAQLTRWRLAARFSHPNLLRLFDAGRCTLDNAEMLYVVMEYADENLGQTLSQRPLSPVETSDLLGPALDALSYIHGKGFVHGHIQPSNILAIGDQIKLSSDGICRLGECGERRNGQSSYSAPECATGNISSASDVWSLGMTLVQCLTENLPQVEAGTRGAVSLPAELPAPFLELARHCLVKAPQRRWSAAYLKMRLLRSPAAVEKIAAPVRHEAPEPEPAAAKRRLPVGLTVAFGGMGLALAAALIGMVLVGSSSNAKRMRSAEAASPAPQPKAAPAQESAASETHSSASSASSNASPAARTVEQLAAPAASHMSAATALARGAIVRRALPDVPRYASNTIWGTVRVRVRAAVDPAGNVIGTQFDSAGPSRYFARLSLSAAREWKFRPPAVNAKSVPSEWAISFDYTKNETTATAVQRNP